VATASEFREMEPEDLEVRLTETSQELFNLRFQVVTGQLENAARISQVRRDVARIHTILREKELQAADEAQARADAEQRAAAVARKARVEASRRPLIAGVAREPRGPDAVTREDRNG